MKLTDNQLKILLLGSNLIPYEKLEIAITEAKNKKISLVDFLPTTSLVQPEQLGRIIADAMKVNFANLRNEKIDEKLLLEIPEHVAKAKGVVLFSRSRSVVKLGMTDPGDFEIRHLIEKKIGQKTSVYYITKQDLGFALAKYQGSVQDKFDEILRKIKNNKLAGVERDEATVEIVDLIMQFGHQSKASDIHIEPFEKEVLVRFRVDGILHDVFNLPKNIHELMVSRFKIMAKMRTDEHRAAQDGKFRFSTDTEDIDVRVSIVPISAGEKAVMRLLSSKNRQFGLTDLGLSDNNLKKVLLAIKNPHGMILVTGPTGSGKTTTVYGVLKLLNKREVNISSIEDPVEYDVDGVNQIQVNNKTKLTFANGLRALLRQDPDIIMIGEIRDEETAAIAVNSALTGHLVLSTLHTNDAATTLPRFLEMGIEPFLVASTVNIAIAQRLTRKICQKCRVSYKITGEELRVVKENKGMQEALKDEGYTDFEKLRMYKGEGCKVCGKTGFSGRLGIFEVLEMNERVKELVVKRANSDAILDAAKASGMETMIRNGVKKIFKGQTTLMEVIRVVSE